MTKTAMDTTSTKNSNLLSISPATFEKR
jgi:hypothetical protein